MASPEGGEEAGGRSSPSAKLAALPERFVALDDVVARELADLDYPWNLKAIEERIQEYTAFSESINAQLSARVMQNYNEFVQGMEQVQSVETELTLIGVLIKNGRRKLQERDTGLLRGGMAIARQRRKSERLARLLGMLSDFQGVVQIDGKLRQCLNSQSYCQALSHNAALREALATEHYRQFPGLVGLRGNLDENLVLLQQRLGDGLRVAAVSSEFDATRYEEILQAYSMMSPDPQALSVGKELLRHVSECIVSVSRQCALAFSAAPDHESTSDWHRNAQLRVLCRSMDPTHFVACTAQLYSCLCDFLYRHQFLCAWHVEREKKAAEDGEASMGFRDVVREVLAELTSSKRAVWDRIQQQVSLVLMTLEFQYPALNEDSFLHILHLTQMLIEEGDAFIADSRLPGSQGSTSLESRRSNLSAPIRNTLKSKAHDYFQSLHFTAWATLKVGFIEQDTWERVTYPRKRPLIRSERLKVVMPRSHVDRGSADGAASKPRGPENNPFRNYKPEPLVRETVGDDEAGEELLDHALLNRWIDDSENTPHEQIGPSMLDSSNNSPVVSKSTQELAQILERYFRLMHAVPQLALDIFQPAMQLIEFYVHCVLRLFVQEKHLRMLLEDLDVTSVFVGDKLAQRHESFLVQQLFPDLRRATVRIRDRVSQLELPDTCKVILNIPANVSATCAALLQVQTFPKLSSPSSLCGLSERCTGVESVSALLSDLKEQREWLTALLPRSSAQDCMDSFAAHETVALQLQAYVLGCAARDILEVPDVGRVSLEHFSNTVQGLKWDALAGSQGSPAAPYVEQQRNQIDELARRIPSAGGGVIRYATQRLVWGWMGVRIMQECAEVISKCGKKKSEPALAIMEKDFLEIRNAVQENAVFKAKDETEEIQLLPSKHPRVSSVQWTYLQQYIAAHRNPPDKVYAWCKDHPEYPLRLHRALLEFVHQNNKTGLRQHLLELESALVEFIVKESANFSQGL